MQFGILGPLEVLHDGARLHMGGVRRRAVLARLLVDPGRTVTTERIIDDVWLDEPPSTARKSVQKYVSELRSTLPEPVLQTTGAGYVLDIDADTLDAWRFERLVIERDYSMALALWRGDVLADLGGLAFVDAERVRLGELRLVAWQGHLESELAAGRHEQVVAELTELLAAHPMRERLVQLQMLALYRSGRQSEALDAFHRHRQLLSEEMGVDPSKELRDLQVTILRQDPGLDLPVSARQSAARSPAGNLPAPLSSFIGRERELSMISHALTGNRIVSLTGPGGVGKTRLALETASRRQSKYDGGAWLVDLAELTGVVQVPAALALTLRVDVRHAPDELTAVEARLTHSGPCLIVLDNCEHLVGACSVLVRRLARNCPDVTVLATSRHPLGVDGEYVVPVSSLSDEDAARLFVERGELTGQAPHGDWVSAEVTELCSGLDGLPLAIELAASQL
ncbi:MAG: BTAD domain-containing putative transcriptional regulator, partial [Nocardioidaceae bacterium]